MSADAPAKVRVGAVSAWMDDRQCWLYRVYIPDLDGRYVVGHTCLTWADAMWYAHESVAEFAARRLDEWWSERHWWQRP